MAPISPPNRACEELDGSPHSQVRMFQMMAPARPAIRISSRPWPSSAINSGFGLPSGFWIRITAFVTVTATSTDRNAPTRFRTADRLTAAFGLSARVAMEVAIALAVS